MWRGLFQLEYAATRGSRAPFRLFFHFTTRPHTKEHTFIRERGAPAGALPETEGALMPTAPPVRVQMSPPM